MVELLLTNNTDIGVMDQNGFTPLHYAVQENQETITEVLLANKADVNTKDIRAAPTI
jgi:ankyrin repeat protein